MRGAIRIIGLAALAGLGAWAIGAAQGGGQAGQQGGGRGAAARMGRDLGPSAQPWDRWQPKRLPTLPSGMTLDMIRSGDSLFHSKGGCSGCHGPDGFGMPNSGSAITLGLGFVPSEWRAIDSLVTVGIPEAVTRSSIAMPPRGASSNLTADEIRRVAAYAWAITRVADEPWPGGHRTHAATPTTASAQPGSGDSAARRTP